ncbi:hypothetical protein EJB05_48085 [Eragrostis curvula]|uniref:Threonylcarbamoyl-AMP synthase n=1 Tax=Eragrostis curvula TaxID=38414 RepID=A0A5J9T269_9POAL|nr:hypothetical protein EJB05_48085 [Eragrostis curvula]
MAAADPAPAASFSSRFCFCRAVSPSPSSLSLPSRQPRLPPGPLRLRASSTIVALHKRNPKRLKYAAERRFTQSLCLFAARTRAKRGDAGMLRVQVEPSGEDFWKLDPVIDLIHRGGVGMIPTDTVYSIVCDLSNNDSIERLRRFSELELKTVCLILMQAERHRRFKGKISRAPLSILCCSLSDIDTYTTGFPRGTNQGQANIFRAVKRAIPGPYTFILPATKQFPKQCIKHGRSTRYAKRKQVGVRIPDDPICQAILQNLDAPLICTRFVV